jgi:DNA-binding NtrC family response regulator
MSAPVLLVEDTETLSMVYSQVLTRAGLPVVCAYSLAEARRKLGEAPPQLVLLDLQLPDGDGLELLESLRETSPELRVIVITANGSIYRAVQAMRAGAFDFLVKPFDDARLLNAVRNALDSAAPPADVADPTEDSGDGFAGFVGNSEPMQGIYRMIRSSGRATATL